MTKECPSTDKTWAPPADILHLNSEEDFTKVQEIIKNAIRKTARLHPYNTLDTFVSFQQAYRSQKTLTLEQFTMVSPVKYEDSCLSCVGLSYKVMKYIAEAEPTLSRHLFLVICSDYDIDTPEPTDTPSNELSLLFDHVLMVLEFYLSGRRGFFLADNALLVDFPIVIMRDSEPPHTGFFRSLSRDGHRETRVRMLSDKFGMWRQTDYKPDKRKVERKRYMYLGRPFLQPDAVERRAKVIPFHGYILMGDGGFKAGLYILLGKDNRRFTLSVPNETGGVNTVRLPYDFFRSDFNHNDYTEHDCGGDVGATLDAFSDLCGFGGREAMIQRFRPLSETCQDEEFIQEAVNLNTQYCAKLKAAILDSQNQQT